MFRLVNLSGSAALVLCVAATITTVQAAPITSLQCLNPGSTSASASQTFVNANSCTDFSYAFPTVQPSTGLNNWQYGYYFGSAGSSPVLNPGTFGLMSPTPAYDGNGNLTGGNAGWWSQNFYQYWTSLDAFEGHSNATYTDLHVAPYCNSTLYGDCGSGYEPRSPAAPESGDFWAARRYIVPNYTGMATVSLSTEKDPRSLYSNSQGVTEFLVQVHNGSASILGCINVLINDTVSPNVQYPNCGTPTKTTDVLNTGQPIYSLTRTFNASPGDEIDTVIMPSYNTSLPGLGAAGHADFASGVFQLETITSVPEPGTYPTMAAGLILLAVFVRRRRTTLLR